MIKNILLPVFVFLLFIPAWADDSSSKIQVYQPVPVHVDYSRSVSVPASATYNYNVATMAATNSAMQNYRRMNALAQPLPKPKITYSQPKFTNQSGLSYVSGQRNLSNQLQKFNSSLQPAAQDIDFGQANIAIDAKTTKSSQLNIDSDPSLQKPLVKDK